MTPLVSVIVPVRNGERTLGNCLTSLLATEYPPERREIVVVDNASTDRSREIARTFPVQCVPEPRRGASHARNRGIEASSGEILAFTDSDCTVSTGWLRELVAGFDGEGFAAVAGEVVALPPRTPAERYAARRKPAWSAWTQRRETPWFLAGNVAVRREALDRIGLFDPRFVGGGEDIDFSWRFFEAGFRLACRPSAVCFHRHRATARGLFVQHIGYSRGQAALRAKYPEKVSWSWREEITAWEDLAASAWRAAGAAARAGLDGGGSANAEYAYLDLVRKLGQRLGFLGGTLEQAARPGARRDAAS
jgi:GT2 family glycosyltransferase